MGLRKVLFIVAGATLACLLICASVFFFTIRAVRTSIHDDVSSAISAVVIQQLSTGTRTAAPRSITLTADDLAEQIANQYHDDGLHSADVVVRFTPSNQITLGVATDTNDVTYTAVLDVENGRVVVRHVDSNEAAIRFLFPAGKVGDAIERGLNDPLDAQNYQVNAMTVTNSSLVLTIAPQTVAVPQSVGAKNTP